MVDWVPGGLAFRRKSDCAAILVDVVTPKRPVTPEVAGSSPVAPVSSFA